VLLDVELENERSSHVLGTFSARDLYTRDVFTVWTDYI
jgi:hypothetical protein